MALSDEEFSRQFYAASTHMQKIQLAIREGRYTIWPREDPPNFPDEYLGPVLDLPANTPVTMDKPRKSGDPGLDYVLKFRYVYGEMGKPITVYLKCYFAYDSTGKLVVELGIQSLKDAE